MAKQAQKTSTPDGEKLKEIRKMLQLNQSEFAESLDISQAALSYLEAGETTMSLSVFKNLIQIFNVNPYAFLTDSKNEPLFLKARKGNMIEQELKSKLAAVRKGLEKISGEAQKIAENL